MNPALATVITDW